MVLIVPVMAKTKPLGLTSEENNMTPGVLR